MNQKTLDRLKELAPFIKSFRELHPREQEWLIPLLTPSVKTALAILDVIANDSLTYEEIANICELHPHSVTQILNALNEGGCDVSLSETQAFSPTGRHRVLARN